MNDRYSEKSRGREESAGESDEEQPLMQPLLKSYHTGSEESKARKNIDFSVSDDEGDSKRKSQRMSDGDYEPVEPHSHLEARNIC